jgi:hypothetical protein
MAVRIKLLGRTGHANNVGRAVRQRHWSRLACKCWHLRCVHTRKQARAAVRCSNWLTCSVSPRSTPPAGSHRPRPRVSSTASHAPVCGWRTTTSAHSYVSKSIFRGIVAAPSKRDGLCMVLAQAARRQRISRPAFHLKAWTGLLWRQRRHAGSTRSRTQQLLLGTAAPRDFLQRAHHGSVESSSASTCFGHI